MYYLRTFAPAVFLLFLCLATPLKAEEETIGFEIEVPPLPQNLDIPVLETAAPFDEEDGYPKNSWAGSSYSEMQSTLEAMPIKSTSPALRAMMEKLLFSSFEIPKENEIIPSSEERRVKKSLWVQRLLYLEYTRDSVLTNELLASIPEKLQVEWHKRLHIEETLLRADYKEACVLSDSASDDYQGSFWQLLGFFCAAVNDNQGDVTASLTDLKTSNVLHLPCTNVPLDLLASRLRPDFKTTEGAVNQVDIRHCSPIELALLSKAHYEFDFTGADSAVIAPGIMASLAHNGALPSVLYRVSAAEFATWNGAMSHKHLGEFYSAVPFMETDFKTVSSDTTRHSPQSYKSAIHFQLPKKFTEDKVLQAYALRQSLDFFEQEHFPPTTIGILAHYITDPSPLLVKNSDFPWFADQFIRILAAASEIDLLKKWYAALQASAVSDKDSAAAEFLAIPIMLTLDNSAEENDRYMESLAQRFKEAPEGKNIAFRLSRILTVLEGLGYSIDKTWWKKVPKESGQVAFTPARADLEALKYAAEKGKKGMVAALTVTLLAENGVHHLSDETLLTVLHSLRKVELDEDARNLAREAMVATYAKQIDAVTR